MVAFSLLIALVVLVVVLFSPLCSFVYLFFPFKSRQALLRSTVSVLFISQSRVDLPCYIRNRPYLSRNKYSCLLLQNALCYSCIFTLWYILALFHFLLFPVFLWTSESFLHVIHVVPVSSWISHLS